MNIWSYWTRRRRPVVAAGGGVRKAAGPHREPEGRPGWWRAALPTSGLLYPDDGLFTLLEEMRRTVPVLDRATSILVGLIGQPGFAAAPSVQAELEEWARRVKVNQTGRGLSTWLWVHADAMLLYGKGVGEIVPADGLREVYALANLDPRSVLFRVTEDPLTLVPLQRQGMPGLFAELDPELALISVNAAACDQPHGISLYRSLPFVAKVMRVVENATAQAWQRLGAPDFHINWEPPEGLADPMGGIASDVLDDLKQQWMSIMSARDPANNGVSDFFTAGKIKVSVIGAEGLGLPITETHRTFMEQLVGVTGLPSWMLGFHWATTERMALQQSEVLVATIEAYRRQLTPALEQLIDLRQRMTGRSGRVKLAWPKVSLHDLTEQARGWAWQEQAKQRRIANAVAMWQLGIWNQLQAAQSIDPAIAAVDRPLDAPPVLPSAGPLAVSPHDGYPGG
jgi:hypothetical protein